MVSAMHIEIDVLFLLILAVIVIQSKRSVSQQMSRVLFRYTVYGIMVILLCDLLWLFVDGRTFPGAMALNRLINVFYITGGLVLACLWYVYVLETLGYTITRTLRLASLLPGVLIMVLSVISLHTGWIFSIDAENHYERGPYFWIQSVLVIGVLLTSMIHLIVRIANGRGGSSRRDLVKILGYYVIPVTGTLLTLPYPGMPGAWTSAAVAVILMYIDDQDSEIVRDSLTGLNNRKTLDSSFADYSRKANAAGDLYLFMIDLNDFKKINDTLGHPVGDEALVNAAEILRNAVEGRKAVVSRVGGDEFLIMGFFPGPGAPEAFCRDVANLFAAFNETEKKPYDLRATLGYAGYGPGYTLKRLIDEADDMLYRRKAKAKVGR